MSRNIPARLDRLEQRNPQGERITEIHLVDGFTGEVGAVIHVQHTTTREVIR